MINRINKIGKKYGMKFNIKKTKTMKVARKAGKLDIMIEGKKLEQIKQYKYLGSIIEEEGRCNKEIRARIGMGKSVFNKKKTTFCSKMDIGLRKRLVKCYVWSTMLHGAETWTLRKKDIEMLESFEMWIWRRMEKIKWIDKITNLEVLRRVDEKINLIQTILRRNYNLIGHNILRGESLMSAYFILSESSVL